MIWIDNFKIQFKTLIIDLKFDLQYQDLEIEYTGSFLLSSMNRMGRFRNLKLVTPLDDVNFANG